MLRPLLLVAAIGGLAGLALVDICQGEVKRGVAELLIAFANLLFLA